MQWLPGVEFIHSHGWTWVGVTLTVLAIPPRIGCDNREGFVAVLRQTPREKFRLGRDPVFRLRRGCSGCVCCSRWACRARQIVFRCMPEWFQIEEIALEERAQRQQGVGTINILFFFLQRTLGALPAVPSLLRQVRARCIKMDFIRSKVSGWGCNNFVFGEVYFYLESFRYQKTMRC